MSRRYPSKKVCPHCGLVVNANSYGDIRPHAGRVLAAGIRDAACLAMPEDMEPKSSLPPHLRADDTSAQELLDAHARHVATRNPNTDGRVIRRPPARPSDTP